MLQCSCLNNKAVLNTISFSTVNLLFDPVEAEMMFVYSNTAVCNKHPFCVL